MCVLVVSSGLGLREIKPHQRPLPTGLTGLRHARGSAGLLLTNKQRTYSTNHASNHPIIHPTIHPYTHPHIHSPPHSFTHPFIHPSTMRPPTHPLIHPFSHPNNPSSMHPYAHPPSCSHIHSSTHPNNPPSIHPSIRPPKCYHIPSCQIAKSIHLSNHLMNNHLNMLPKHAKFDLKCSKMHWRGGGCPTPRRGGLAAPP